jgi:hypothetical protein
MGRMKDPNPVKFVFFEKFLLLAMLRYALRARIPPMQLLGAALMPLCASILASFAGLAICNLGFCTYMSVDSDICLLSFAAALRLSTTPAISLMPLR